MGNYQLTSKNRGLDVIGNQPKLGSPYTTASYITSFCQRFEQIHWDLFSALVLVGKLVPWREEIAAKQSYKSANARVRSSRRNLGPPTSRAASGGGNISPWWGKPTLIKRPNWTKLLPTNLHGRLAMHWCSRTNETSGGKDDN